MVTAEFVLTAAHCALSPGANGSAKTSKTAFHLYVEHTKRLSRWTLLFGNVDLNATSDDAEATSRTIEETHIHPKWKK